MSREMRESIGYLANAGMCALGAWCLWPSPYALMLAGAAGFGLGLLAAMLCCVFVWR